MSKKVTALCLAATCLLSSAGVNAAWYDDAMNKSVQNKYIQGDENGELHPERNITRAEFASILKRITGIYNYSNTVGFSDVASGAWYINDINAAVTVGLFNGVSDSEFAPEAYITRQEAAVALYRAFYVPESDEEITFTDGGEIADWAKEAVFALCGGGYISGYPDGSFKPSGNITRAEVASILTKLAENYVSTINEIQNKSFDGNLVITKETALTNVTVNGDIYYAPGVGKGEVRLTNVKANRIIYCGENSGKIGLDNVEADGVYTSGNVHKTIMVTGEGKIGKIVLDCDSDILLMDYVGDEVDVDAKASASLSGDFGVVTLYGGASITLADKAVIGTLVTDKDSGGSTVGGTGTVKNVKADAEVKVGGNVVAAGTERAQININDSEKSGIKESFSGESGRVGVVSWSDGSQTSGSSVFTNLYVSDSSLGEMTPSFSAKRFKYTVNVGCETESIDMTASFAKEYSCVLNEEQISSGRDFTLDNLKTGENTFVITCYKGAREITKYTITVVKAEELSGSELAELDNKLGSLTVNDLKDVGITGLNDLLIDEYNDKFVQKRDKKGSALTQSEYQSAVNEVNKSTTKLSGVGITAQKYYKGGFDFGKSFAAGETSISVKVDNYVESVEITPISINKDANVTINGHKADASSAYSQDLSVGNNTVTIETSSDTYTISIVRDDVGAITKNRYFHDGTNGYISSVTGSFEDGFLVLDSDSATESIENEEYFSLNAGDEVSVKLHCKASTGRVPTTIYLKDENGNTISLGTAIITTGAAKEYKKTYTVKDAGKYKAYITYKGVLMIDELSAEVN